MTSEQQQIFPAEPVTSLQMSKAYDTPEVRGTAVTVRSVTWPTFKPGHGKYCQECWLVQYETGGKHRRNPARKVRNMPGVGTLALCSLHAEAWAERDERTRAGVPDPAH